MFCFSPSRRALIAALLLACSGLSQARLSFAWSFMDWEPVLGPTDTLVLRAQLFNDHSSTELLHGSRLLDRFAEGIGGAYDFADALPSLAAQLQGVELDPGESIEFDFGRLVPQSGRVAPGSYFGGGFTLSFADDAGRAVSWTPDRSLIVTVQDTPAGTVPEPGLPALLLLAGVAAAVVRRGVRGA